MSEHEQHEHGRDPEKSGPDVPEPEHHDPGTEEDTASGGAPQPPDDQR